MQSSNYGIFFLKKSLKTISVNEKSVECILNMNVYGLKNIIVCGGVITSFVDIDSEKTLTTFNNNKNDDNMIQIIYCPNAKKVDFIYCSFANRRLRTWKMDNHSSNK